MLPNDSEFERYYEQFSRDHQRLRGQLLDSLPSPAAEDRLTRRFRERLRWPRLVLGRKPLTGLATAALVAIIVAIVMLRDTATSVTYANVLACIERVRSVQFTRTMVKPVGIEQPVRVFVLGRYLERQEHLGPDGEVQVIYIKNLQTGVYVAIDPLNKQFRILSRQRTFLLDGTAEEVTELKPAPSADIFKMVEELPPDAVPAFSKQEFNGRKVIGFYHEQEKGVYLWKSTYWVDAETMLPVRIETIAGSSDPQWSSAEWVRSDFVFDADPDPSLFSTEPPEGYRVIESEIQGIRMPTPQDVQQ